MSNVTEKRGMGWVPDFPDFRDFTKDQAEISSNLKLAGQRESVSDMLKKTEVAKTKVQDLPLTMDLRPWCSPIENQGDLGSCTANAAVGIVEYFEKKSHGKYINASRLFLYKATRDMLHWEGDQGASLRATMGALVLFGVPPDEYWPYDVATFDKEPSAFCYSFAQNYKAITYYRFDPPNTDKKALLTQIKTYLANGLPSMFGFSVFNSIDQADKSGKIPYPTKNEKILDGHAVAAVGYDDHMEITNTYVPNQKPTKGALLIRNSWGTEWGEGGYGWLPYDYVLKGLAIDWWSLLKSEWVDTGIFTSEK